MCFLVRIARRASHLILLTLNKVSVMRKTQVFTNHIPNHISEFSLESCFLERDNNDSEFICIHQLKIRLSVGFRFSNIIYSRNKINFT